MAPATRRSTRISTRKAAAQAPAAPAAAAAAVSTPTKTTNSTTTTRSTRRKTKKPPASTASSTTTPTKKIKLSGLQNSIQDVSTSLGVIDPEAKNIASGSSIASLDDAPCDVMLALLDPAKNTDKFFILQLIQQQPSSNNDNNTSYNYVVYTRWGRTGTVGQALQQDFAEWDDAVKCFQDKFRQKTKLTWEHRNDPSVGGKYYRFVPQNYEQKKAGFQQAKWQYWVDDGVDGKSNGWYDYDTKASQQVERLYQEFQQTPALSQRWVDSGAWTYNVNLLTMVQTNVTHTNHTSRRIRRFAEEEEDQDKKKAAAAPTVVPSTPVKKQAAPTATTATPVPATPVSSSAAAAAPAVVTPAKPTTKATHPVDPDIRIQGQNPADYLVVQGDVHDWYDITLNQCNIGNNNNKYYRLQLLTDKATKSSFYCWFRWGRVREASKKSASTWSGPYSDIQAAHKLFAKKYRDKSGNALGADPFVEKKGKYVPVEIDNDVEVDDDMKLQPQQDEEEVEYMPSALDAKTKELVEVLFSEEMRNEALSSFSIDLKKLPLGVPSKPQIQRGIDILGEIEAKLNGTAASNDSYEELSSRFFTAIPHSFGRSRPPVIQNQKDLQTRYDVCNILLDMYDTNDTIRKIAKDRKAAKKKTLPHPVDQHYRSMKAALQLVSKQDPEFAIIQQYFEATKHTHSKSKLLDIWSVDRENEGQRFTKFSQLENRRLLWHGTNIAVVAPILTSGLRIMPHSGGRVGSGIYLANLQQKSAQYTRGYGSKFACMFLCEAPLGKQHALTQDGKHAYSLTQAPAGFDSVHAVGRETPSAWTTMELDGATVSVPSGKPKDQNSQSDFYHDEMLVYDESQVRLRYVVTVKL